MIINAYPHQIRIEDQGTVWILTANGPSVYDGHRWYDCQCGALTSMCPTTTRSSH